MDYGISLGISCFGEGLFKDGVFRACPNSLLFSGCHFVPQIATSRRDTRECRVNTQQCVLTPCVSHVEICQLTEAAEHLDGSLLCPLDHFLTL